MRLSMKFTVVSLAAAAMLAVAGCKGGSEGESTSPKTAAIGGSEAEQPGIGSETPGATHRSRADPSHPTVVIDTSLGGITVQLDAEKAPLTVDNFLAYVESGHYERTVFHQVLKDYPRVVIGGAFTADLVEKNASTPVRNEAHNGLSNRRGTIAMARQGDAVDSATCHFFFNLTDNHEVLDHKDRTLEGYGYCVFGKVTAGMDVIDKIGGVEVHDTTRFERIPVTTVTINSIRRIE